ncbi:methylated-DNA-protein-cysteine methyltransferase-like protein [Silvibacterium bohemicum]|uniref:Methylated-DNA-protein-cysteine methyltransferase-like protein n=1 Tax=Silvibacterium bohemicum TaxID=1577686 RepID=A0A841JW48_9BACT|nr:MGMT family protein [Silvibacterium bohemicum]MBB6142668.1 methylated-DNA-protein-cysteine methyltransferase-like protein [Silvibacterium bohemicum]
MSPEPKSKQRPSRKNLAFDQLSVERAKRSLLRDASRPNEQRDLAFRRMILSIPAGKVSTYGGVAAAAGYPRYHRAVARLLRTDPVDQLPWHRVLGAGGEIKLRGAAAREQRARLKLEGVQFSGKRVDMGKFEHSLKPWELYR